ncbi:hypothetical protein AGDE_12711 [Angomonas deanei]|nr:hypothetical protein AGDE_12711 [Angomonas deanei]|eukprot:EPY23816.1 hypothetical protein AGDE_12711 [Angomonas deanei]
MGSTPADKATSPKEASEKKKIVSSQNNNDVLPEQIQLGTVRLVLSTSSLTTESGESLSSKVLKTNPFRKEAFHKSSKDSDNSVKSFSFVGEVQSSGALFWYYAPLESYEKKKLRVEESVVTASAVAAQNARQPPSSSAGTSSNVTHVAQFFLRLGNSNTFREYVTCPHQTVDNKRDPSSNIEPLNTEIGRVESVGGHPVPQNVIVDATRYYDDSSIFSPSDGAQTPTLALYTMFEEPEESDLDCSCATTPTLRGCSTASTFVLLAPVLPKSPSSSQRSNPRLKKLRESTNGTTCSSCSTAFLSSSNCGAREEMAEVLPFHPNGSTHARPCISPPTAPASSRRPTNSLLAKRLTITANKQT